LNKNILNFLNKITDTKAVDKLLVTTFLKHKKIYITINDKINNLSILKDTKEYAQVEEFDLILQNENQKLCFEELLELFEFVISPSDKLINGAIYTPKKIREYITRQSFNELKKNNIDKIKIADIACGCGGFLIDASNELHERTGKSFKKIFKENIIGIDIQKYSI